MKNVFTNTQTGSFLETACGFVIEFVDIITERIVNNGGVYNGVQYDAGWNIDSIRLHYCIHIKVAFKNCSKG